MDRHRSQSHGRRTPQSELWARLRDVRELQRQRQQALRLHGDRPPRRDAQRLDGANVAADRQRGHEQQHIPVPACRPGRCRVHACGQLRVGPGLVLRRHLRRLLLRRRCLLERTASRRGRRAHAAAFRCRLRQHHLRGRHRGDVCCRQSPHAFGPQLSDLSGVRVQEQRLRQHAAHGLLRSGQEVVPPDPGQ